VVRKRILIVDDHLVNLEVLRIMLGDGYDVLTWSGLEALKAVDEFEPDLLILDVRMYKQKKEPAMTGQVLQYGRGQQAFFEFTKQAVNYVGIIKRPARSYAMAYTVFLQAKAQGKKEPPPTMRGIHPGEARIIRYALDRMYRDILKTKCAPRLAAAA
jgi:CheY-like chemotaxis protein